jgi:plasmid stability protein
MANLTLSIDDDVLRRARIRALEQNTSVNAVVREFLASYAGTEDRERARREILKLAKASNASSGPGGRKWKREDIYEERLGRYGSR